MAKKKTTAKAQGGPRIDPETNAPEHIYSERLVAFVDILGWSEACKTESPTLVQATALIHERAAGASSARKNDLLSRSPRELLNPLWFETEFAAFSDNFVVSQPLDFGERITEVADLCRHLLRLGFPTRGGLTVGKIHHRDNVVFGPALVEAADLEKTAIYPRLVVSPALVDLLNKQRPEIGNYWRPTIYDQLGRRVVNLFNPPIYPFNDQPLWDHLEEMWGLSEILRVIEVNVDRFTRSRNDKLLEKWLYLREATELMLAPVHC